MLINVNLRTEGYNQQLRDQIILSNFMPKINHKLSMHDASATVTVLTVCSERNRDVSVYISIKRVHI